MARLTCDQILQGSLPAGLGFISGPLSAQLENLTRELTVQAVSSNAFRGFWAAANRRAHPIVIEAIKSKGKLNVDVGGLVSLDLVEVTEDITDLLGTSGIALPGALPKRSPRARWHFWIRARSPGPEGSSLPWMACTGCCR